VKILSLRAVTVIAASIGWSLPQALAAPPQPPRDTTHITPAGNYLAARQANLERDADAASIYYRAALRTDQRNPELLELAFYSVLADGDIDEATRLAERLIQLDRNNRNAHLVLGVKALKTKNYKEARQQFIQATRGPVTDLTATLLAGWSAAGANDSKGAVDTIDKLSGPEWYAIDGNHRWMPGRATLRIGGPSAATQQLYVHGAHVGDHRHIGWGDRAELRDLAGPPHCHLEHQHLGPHSRSQNCQRQADLGVEVLGARLEPGREERAWVGLYRPARPESGAFGEFPARSLRVLHRPDHGRADRNQNGSLYNSRISHCQAQAIY